MAQTPSSKGAQAAISKAFPGRFSFQRFSCRKIAGSQNYSQHAWDNALDIFGSRASLDALYEWLTRRRGPLRLRVICWQDLGGCTTKHTNHIHVDFHPKGIGTPPCAGGITTFQDASGIVTGSSDVITRDSALAGMAATQIATMDCVTLRNAATAGEIRNLKGATLDAALNRLNSCMNEGTIKRQNIANLVIGLGPSPKQLVENVAESVTEPFAEVGAFLSKITQAEFWIRVGAGIGGIGLALVGIVLIAKSQGATVPLPGPLGAVRKATG